MDKKITNDSSYRPQTYDPNFHGYPDTNEWINKMPYRSLGKTGLDVSLLSYGGSYLANFYGDQFSQQDAVETIQSAIKAGVNYLDTSPWYGDSEKCIGHALQGVPRGTYYIGTKVGRNFTPGWANRFDFSRAAVLKNFENSLSRLGLDYVDIIQIHDLEFCLEPELIWRETLPALESFVRAGKAKFIGITGYDFEAMTKAIELSSVKIDTVLSYSRMNFHDTKLLDYVEYFKSKDIGIINASPVAMGLYTSKGPPDWHPASDEVKTTVKEVVNFAKTHGKTIEEVSLGFSLRPQNPYISTTLVSMPKKDILQQNLEVVTTPRVSSDEILYNEVVQIFKTKLTGSGDWKGKELAEYKLEMQK